MAITVQHIHPVAHLPLVLGVLRRLEVATVVDRLIPPHPAHGLSCGRGVEALELAILDGHHALYKVGRRLEERGMVTLLQPGLTRIALNDYRLGHILEALFAANLNKVYGAIALKALEVYALPTPWLHQDPTTIALYGAYADEPTSPEAPHPAYGHSKDGRDDLKQVLLSLGVSGDGGIPLRLGMRDGKRSDSVATPVAIEECLALGLEGVRGMVADSKAYSRRTLGLCLEHGLGLVTKSRGCAPFGRNSRPGGASPRPCPSSWRSPAGPRTKSHAVGMGTASAAASRSRTVRGGSPRRRCALSSCIPVSWPSSMPRRMSVRKRRKRRPWPTMCGRCTHSGLPAGPMPRPPSPPMRARGRAAAGAGRAPGGITRSAIASWQRVAARAVPVGVVPLRQTRRRPSRTMASW
jgi:Domain of unknown function (DUF4277)